MLKRPRISSKNRKTCKFVRSFQIECFLGITCLESSWAYEYVFRSLFIRSKKFRKIKKLGARSKI